MDNFEVGRDTIALILTNGSYLMRQISGKCPVLAHYDLPGEFSIIYIDTDNLNLITSIIGGNRPELLPVVFGPLGRPNLEAAGIAPMHGQPYLTLKGQGVLLGFVDTGIDYTQKAFMYEDGASKIKYIWDQTIDGAPPDGLHFGTEYTDTQINQALSAEDPFSVVPHRDNVGHGTFLASVAASRDDGLYVGAAPDADIIAVKLRKARKFLLDEYLVPEAQESVFESVDIMLGVDYIVNRADALNRPVAICIGLGSNIGGHDGFNPLEEYLSSVSNRAGVCVSVAAGNESQARHHCQGVLSAKGSSHNIDIKVAEGSGGFWLGIWNSAADRLSVAVRSPTGEVIGRFPPKAGRVEKSGLVFEKSEVTIRYFFPVGGTGAQLSYLRIADPTPGIWTVVLYGDSVLDGTYHVWMPMTDFVSPGVEFFSPSPNHTVVVPATTISVITSGAFDAATGRLYEESSWGPTRLPTLDPDFSAPGVNVLGFFPGGKGSMTGTSVASAITAGASALLLQWGIINGNDITMNTYRIRALLISGCERDPNITYPNSQWGYGRINLHNTFTLLKST